MSLQYIESGLRPHLTDEDTVKSGLANILVTAAKAWREIYGDIPQPGQTVKMDTDVQDMTAVFGCSAEQIAGSMSEVTPDTRAYVGPLEKGIFGRLRSIEHIYTSFPEGKITRGALRIGGNSREWLEAKLEQRAINTSGCGEDVIHNHCFSTLKETQILHTVTLRFQDLGLEGTPTRNEIYARAEEFDLYPCPAEAGVYQRLEDTDQPLRDWYVMTMEPIPDRHNFPQLFRLARHRDGSVWLGGHWFPPKGRRCNPGLKLVFWLRDNPPES